MPNPSINLLGSTFKICPEPEGFPSPPRHLSLCWSIWILAFVQGRITEGFPGRDREVTLAVGVCWSQLTPVHKSKLENFQECRRWLTSQWQHEFGHGKTTYTTDTGKHYRSRLPTPCSPLSPSHQNAQHLPAYNCMCKSVLQKDPSCVIGCVILISIGVYICEYTLAPEEPFPPYICLLAWTQLGSTRSGASGKRLLAMMQVRDEGTKHRKEASGQRNLEIGRIGFVIYSERTRFLSFTPLLSV